MRAQTRSTGRQGQKVIDESFFERKASELVVADDEIEAWELNAGDLDDLTGFGNYLDAPGSE